MSYMMNNTENSFQGQRWNALLSSQTLINIYNSLAKVY